MKPDPSGVEWARLDRNRHSLQGALRLKGWNVTVKDELAAMLSLLEEFDHSVALLVLEVSLDRNRLQVPGTIDLD